MTSGDLSSGAKHLGSWISVVSAIVTIGLSIVTANMQGRISQAQLDLERQSAAFDQQMRAGAAELERTRERTSRYTFVNTLLPNVLDADADRRTLTINLIKLSLAPEEASALFTGLSQSSNETTRAVGAQGLDIIRRERNAASTAAEHERAGFVALIRADHRQAVDAFRAAERAFPTYHNVSEISHLLAQRGNDVSDPEARRRVIRRILAVHSWGIPSDLRPALVQAAADD